MDGFSQRKPNVRHFGFLSLFPPLIPLYIFLFVVKTEKCIDLSVLVWFLPPFLHRYATTRAFRLPLFNIHFIMIIK